MDDFALSPLLLPKKHDHLGPPSTSLEASAAEIETWRRTHHRSHQYEWHVDFKVMEEMPLSPRPMTLSRQVVVTPDYYSDGRLRAAHEHCYFCYSLAGAGTFWDGAGVHSVPAGWGFLMEINDPQTGYRSGPDQESPWQFLAFEFTGLAARALVRDLIARYGSLFALTLQAPIVQRFQSYKAKAYTVAHPHAIDWAEMVIELLLALAASVRARSGSDATQDLVKRATQLIEEHGELMFSVTDLARRLGVSRERLSRVFRLRLNLSPHQLIQEQKIRRACFLLKDTDMPIKQIAAHLGYADYTNFIRAFRQVTQMTPHEFHRHGSIQSTLPLPHLPRVDGSD